MRFKFGMRILLISLLINAGLVRPAFAVNQQQESGTQRQADKTLTFAMVGDVMMGTTFPSVQLPPMAVPISSRMPRAYWQMPMWP